MLSGKDWKPESIFRLLMALFLGLALVGILGQAAERLLPGETAERHQAIAMGGTLVFQLASLGLVQWFVRENRSTWRQAFGLSTHRWQRVLLLSVVVAVVVFPINLSLMWISQRLMEWQAIEPVPQATVEALQRSTSFEHRLILGVMAVLFAPVVEEVLFRGVFYPALKEAGFPRVALWGTALVFAATHANLMTFLPLTFFAIVLTRLYEETDNLAAPILTHGLFNAANFTWLVLSSANS